MAVSWSEFYQASLARPLHPLWQEIDPHLAPGMRALDLGCGVGRCCLHMLDKGLSVTAVDNSEEAIEIISGRLPEGSDVDLRLSAFEDLVLDKESFDLVSAFFSIFFLPPTAFAATWENVVVALKPGGIFAGQLLGVRDEWASLGYTCHDHQGVEELLRDFEIVHLEEVERQGETIIRTPKYWHVFHVVARKKQMGPT